MFTETGILRKIQLDLTNQREATAKVYPRERERER